MRQMPQGVDSAFAKAVSEERLLHRGPKLAP